MGNVMSHVQSHSQWEQVPRKYVFEGKEGKRIYYTYEPDMSNSIEAAIAIAIFGIIAIGNAC